MQTTTIRCEADLLQKIDALAQNNNRSRSWVITQALAEYVDRATQQDRYKADVLESWRHYQETGLHVTGDELKAWLATWGTPLETEAPQCHK